MRAALFYALAFNAAAFGLALAADVTLGPVAAAATLGGCLGAAVASYLHLVGGRLAAGVPVSGPPSHCPACGTAVKPRHNVPVAGWLLLGGRCAGCRARIPWHSLAAEVAGAVAGAAVFAAGAFAG